jgi:hypothetical protein
MNINTNPYSAFNVPSLRNGASLAYKISTSYLYVKEQIAKIAQNVFHAFFDTPCRMLLKCLCVSVVLCGGLTLTYLIINTCWNRYSSLTSNPSKQGIQKSKPLSNDFYKNQEVRSLSNDSPKIFSEVCENFPQEIVERIFDEFNLSDLGVCSQVNKNWNNYIIAWDFWRRAIYREYAFTSVDWAKWDPELVKGIDLKEEMLSLPENIVDELRRSHKAFPEKSLKNTHIFARLPKGLNIIKLSNLAKKDLSLDIYGDWNDNHFGCFAGVFCTPVKESVWLLMSTNAIEGSSEAKNYCEQMNIVAEFAKTTQTTYEVPTALEAIVCILVKHRRAQTSLYGNENYIYTWTQDHVRGDRKVIVDEVPSKGICLDHYNFLSKKRINIKPLRKF